MAFLDLLLLVSGLRSIKFYKVCPIDHLLSRMETDSVHVVKRIVSLLVNSFQPSNVPPYKQVQALGGGGRGEGQGEREEGREGGRERGREDHCLFLPNAGGSMYDTD